METDWNNKLVIYELSEGQVHREVTISMLKMSFINETLGVAN